MNKVLCFCLLVVILSVTQVQAFKSKGLFRISRNSLLSSNIVNSKTTSNIAATRLTTPVVTPTNNVNNKFSIFPIKILAGLKLSPASMVMKAVTVILTSIFLFSKAAFAKAKINGWDLYGRVPYDDFLFSNANLLDANLFKRSMVEAVMTEIPDAYNSFKRSMMIEEVIGGSKSALKFILLCAAVGVILKFRPRQSNSLKDRFTQIRGFDTPLSARLKRKK